VDRKEAFAERYLHPVRSPLHESESDPLKSEGRDLFSSEKKDVLMKKYGFSSCRARRGSLRVQAKKVRTFI